MIKIISSLLVLIIALSPIYASSEAIVNSMPGGDLNMISIDDGKLFFQIDSSIYRYDPTQPDPFVFEYESQNKELKFAFVLGGNLYYNAWGESNLVLAESSDGQEVQEKIELYHELFQNSELTNIQPFLLSASEGNMLTFMAAAINKRNRELFFLCRLNIVNGEFKNIEVHELKSFMNLKNGNTLFFNQSQGNNGNQHVFVNEIDWRTMESKQIDSIPRTAQSCIYFEKSGLTIFVDGKRMMQKSSDKEAEVLMDLSSILQGDFAWPDQRGILIQNTSYIVPIMTGPTLQALQINLKDIETGVIQ